MSVYALDLRVFSTISNFGFKIGRHVRFREIVTMLVNVTKNFVWRYFVAQICANSVRTFLRRNTLTKNMRQFGVAHEILKPFYEQ